MLDGGAGVRLVCLEPPSRDLPERMTWRTEPYRAEHLDGVSLAFAAATAEVNAQVVSDARSRNIWVNSASDPDSGDFVLPAVGGRGRIRIAVDTGSASPALAGSIRDVLGRTIDEAMVVWVNLVAEIRPLLRTVLSEEHRRGLLVELARPDWLDRIRTDGPDAVRAAMRALVEAEAGR
jgi:precorrin-2 dehydrogenase / sirohydrochlorin ferrochelatase